MTQKKETLPKILYRATFTVDYSMMSEFKPDKDMTVFALNDFYHPVTDRHTAKWLVLIGDDVHAYRVHANSKSRKVIVHPPAVLTSKAKKVLRETLIPSV